MDCSLKGLARAEAMLGVAPVPDPERFAKYRGDAPDGQKLPACRSSAGR